MRTIAQAGGGRDNHFNLIRLAAASAVLVSHSWPLALGSGATEPLQAATGYKLGTIAVILFFAISGYLITSSFERRRSLADYAVGRLLRLYPALVVAIAATALLLGPIASRLPLADYAADPASWSYPLRNLLLAFPQWHLPGVFAGNPAAGEVNGSLWTLWFEVGCYAAVALAGIAGLLAPRRFPLLLVALLALQCCVPATGETRGMTAWFILLGLPFAIGAALHVHRAHVPASLPLAGLILLDAALLRDSWLGGPLLRIGLSYGVVCLGLAAWRAPLAWNRLGDYSYGLYLFAYPVQQCLAAAAGPLTPWRLAAMAWPISLALAILSWHLIEAPALARRRRLVDRIGGSGAPRAGGGPELCDSRAPRIMSPPTT